ncbi:MAG TPA: hypothetical protein VK890_13850 [Bacteroidia bacterium]|jgi:hypothetical protein|nr:hypothetical protein [Bacteroidia bacterium]
MLAWIKNIFSKKNKGSKTTTDIATEEPVKQEKFIWCLIGNIVDTTESENKVISGTKHFLPRIKVYCFPQQWGDGYENIKVIGRHRDNNRYVNIVMQSKYITNWRLQKVYRPYILNVMRSKYGWTDSNNDKERILEMLKVLTTRVNNTH